MSGVQAFFTSKYFIASLVIIGLAIFGWIFVAKTKNKWFWGSEKKKNTFTHVVFDAIKVIIPVVIILALLEAFGINVNGLIAGLGIAGATVGFALQDILKDIIMGFHITTDKFFQVGDIVRYGDREGRVVDFNLRTTKLELTINKELVSICNRNISEVSIAPPLCSIRVNLSYEDDHVMVGKVLTGIAAKIAELEGVERARFAGTEEFLDSAISYAIFFWCENPADRYELHRQAMLIVQNGLKEAGIKIPYRQMDVHFPDKDSGKYAVK